MGKLNQSDHQSAPPWFIFVAAAAIGSIAANLYYSQPILETMAAGLGLQKDSAGLIVAMVQIGYGLGVLLIVPLGDLLRNKRLALSMIFVATLAEIGLGSFQSLIPFMICALLAGFGTSTVQILVPYMTHLYPPSERGEIVGKLMSGLMLGVLLSRPVASLLSAFFSFHAVFYFSAAIMMLIFFVLLVLLPERHPVPSGLRYYQLILSMKDLFLNTSVLRWRSLYQALIFGSFCLFWSTVPVLVMSDQIGLNQIEMAIFALVGVAGAVVAPYAGRFADRGHSRVATVTAFGLGVLGFALSLFVGSGKIASLVILTIGANLLDAGVASHLVLGQRAIFMIDPSKQSRLNGLYIATIFVGGGLGSAIGNWVLSHFGWTATMLVGMAFPMIALILTLTWEPNQGESLLRGKITQSIERTKL